VLLGGGLCARRADHSCRVVLPSEVCLRANSPICACPLRTRTNRAVEPREGNSKLANVKGRRIYL
jgi:hypothetical protein